MVLIDGKYRDIKNISYTNIMSGNAKYSVLFTLYFQNTESLPWVEDYETYLFIGVNNGRHIA